MGSYKKLGWSDSDVKCPFYIRDSRQQRSICCEGYAKDTSVVSCFRTTAMRDRHMGVFCVEKYESCPMFKFIYDCKYREDKDSR